MNGQSFQDTKPIVAFVGLGLMGVPMARRLLSAGVPLRVYDLARAQVDLLAREGAVPCADPAEAVRGADTLITMLPEARHVEQVLTGPGGAMAALAPGALHIDMSTISPADCARIAETLAARQVHFLDAPVSGGVGGAEAGTLSIMVGGDEAQYRRALPLLEIMGKQITHMGGTGMGQTAKCCNQVVGAITLQAVCEGLSLAKKAGLSLEKLLPAMEGGAADSFMLGYVGSRVIKDDYAPGFRVRLELKDLGIALKTAAEVNAPLPALALVDQFFRSRAASGGMDSEGNQALMRVYDLLGNVAR